MAKDQAPIARFPLPDDWEPEGTRCVIVNIPDDPQYLATLTGLLDLLKWSDNFARDDTKEGAATVCRTWQKALEAQPLTWGDCEQMILRQNPTNPCQLQQSQDGGDTWTLAFDYSLCADVITVPAPYPGSETGASDAAAASMRNIFEQLCNLVDCEASRDSYIATATAYMRTYDAGYANPAALGAIYDAFCALDPTEQDYAKSDCPYQEHKDDMEACASVEGLYDWLNCAAATINGWLDDTSSDLMSALNQAAAALTGNGWQNTAAGGSGGGAGFGATCEWCIELTPAFHLGQYFECYNDNVDYCRATWVPGSGWAVGGIGQEPNLIQLQTSCPDQAFHITTLKLEGNAAGTEVMQLYSPNFSGTTFALNYTGGAAEYTFTVDADVYLGIAITYKPGSTYGAPGDMLTKITICGTGAQPDWACNG